MRCLAGTITESSHMTAPARRVCSSSSPSFQSIVPGMIRSMRIAASSRSASTRCTAPLLSKARSASISVNRSSWGTPILRATGSPAAAVVNSIQFMLMNGAGAPSASPHFSRQRVMMSGSVGSQARPLSPNMRWTLSTNSAGGSITEGAIGFMRNNE